MSRRLVWLTVLLFGVVLVCCHGRNTFAEPASDKGKEPTASADLVKQALDNEVAADGEGRRKLLEQAIDVDPQYPPAHWHLGQVRVADAWLPAAEAMVKAADAELTAEYEAKRSEASGNAALELKLAQWCVKNGMPDRARLHFWCVLGNPNVTESQVKDAARQLDLVSVGGTILTRDALKQEQQREKRIADAIGTYRPIVAQLQPVVDAGFDEKHDEAVRMLEKIDDPAVIPAIESYLHGHQESFGEELVKLLAKFPQYESTQTLVRFAVVSPFLSVREKAIEALKGRPMHDYAPTLLAGLVSPIQPQFRFAIDRTGTVTYQQVFRQEAANATFHVRQYVELRPVSFPASPGSKLSNLPEGSRRLLRARGGVASRNLATELRDGTGSSTSVSPYLALMELSLIFEGQQLHANAANLAADRANKRVYPALEQTTEQQLPRDPNAWWNWWRDYNELHYPKPTYWASAGIQSGYVQSYRQRQPVYNQYWEGWAPIWSPRPWSCFVAGTPVWTESGIRPIESIQAGDRVLSQDPETGELSFKVVIGKTVRPPTEASKLTVNGETITTTLGHPLWVTGKGWEMAKHVKEGDQLHGIGGIVNVNAIDSLPNKVEAHNLVVDDFNTYFVGNCGLLVHDNTYRKPTRAVVPGLVPDVAGKIGK